MTVIILCYKVSILQLVTTEIRPSGVRYWVFNCCVLHNSLFFHSMVLIEWLALRTYVLNKIIESIEFLIDLVISQHPDMLVYTEILGINFLVTTSICVSAC